MKISAIVNELWPKRFAPGHLEGLDNQTSSLELGQSEARVILQQVWAQKGRYATPAAMVEALKSGAGQGRGSNWTQPGGSELIDALLRWGERTLAEPANVSIKATRDLYRGWLDTIYDNRQAAARLAVLNDLLPTTPSRREGVRFSWSPDWTKIEKVAEMAGGAA